MKPINSRKIKLVLLTFVFTGTADVSLAAICRFQALGDLSGGDFYSEAHAVSADGKVVVGESYSASGQPFEAFRWENGVMIGLGDLPGSFFRSHAYGVSTDGSVIVGISATTLPVHSLQAFRWENGVMTGLGGLPGSPIYSKAYAVSGDGSVIVGESRSAFGTEAFRWTEAEGMVGLGDLTGFSRVTSRAYGVSADGSVIVGESWSAKVADFEAFRWTQQEGMVGLGFLEPPDIQFSYSKATAVSGDGSTIVGYTSSPLPVTAPEAFRWEDGVMMGLGVGGSAYAVSADGSIVVGGDDVTGGVDAFIWDAKHGTRDLRSVLVDECGLDLTGWTLTTATGVSADGLTIVGYGTNPDGLTEGWIATIPEPATFALLAFGGLALLRTHRP